MIERQSMKRFWKLFLCNLIIFVLFCGFFVFNKHFSTDDYNAYYDQRGNAYSVIQLSYRNFLGLLYIFLNYIHINVVENQVILGALLIICLSFAVTGISNEINSLINDQENNYKSILINLGAVILFGNAFLAEWLWFSLGYIQWAFAAVTAIYGAICIGKSEKIDKRWLLGTILWFLAAGNYQIILVSAVYIVMIITFFRWMGVIKKESILAVIRAALSACIAIVGNIFTTKILAVMGFISSGSRMDIDLSDIKALLIEIVKMQKTIWVDSEGMLPKGLLLGLLLLLLSVLFIGMYRRKEKLLTYLYIIIILLSGQAVLYLAVLMQGTIWLPARILLPLFGVFSILIWLICYYLTEKKIIFPRILMVIIIFFIGVNFCSVQKNAADALITNNLDKFYIEAINNYISKYEQENNLQIAEAGFCSDASRQTKYGNYINNNTYFGELSNKGFATEWSDIQTLNYYTGRSLIKTEMPEDIKEYFLSQNWMGYDAEEQIVFRENCVYICIY